MDATGEPIIGASVLVKGTGTGTVTNVDGNFSVDAQQGSTLVISFVGYTSAEIKVGAGSIYNVTLADDTQALEEVVVTAMGIKKERKSLGYAVDDVNAKELMKNKSTNAINSLAGKVAGVTITQTSGAAGAGSQIILRGGTSLERDNQPLFVVDGVIYDNSTSIIGNSAYDGMKASATTGSNRVMDINPEDIENMSILKGPAASALYGSRAAAGVILITTKKGKAGKMQVNYNNNFRYSGPTNLPELLDSYSFANYFNEMSVNQGNQIIFTEETMQRIQDYMAGKITDTTVPNGTNWHFHEKANDNVDWYKVHFKWAWSNEHNISLNGGTEKLQYYVSGNYLNQNGNLRYGNDNLKRYNFTAKVNTQINKYIDFNINTKFIRFDLDNPLYSDMGGLLYHDIARMWPMMPFKDPNGHYMRNGKLAQLTEGGRAKTHNDNIYLQGQLVLHPLKNWNIYVEGGLRIINENQ